MNVCTVSECLPVLTLQPVMSPSIEIGQVGCPSMF